MARNRRSVPGEVASSERRGAEGVNAPAPTGKKTASSVPGGQRKVYVLYVHGIGVDHEDAYVGRTVPVLTRALSDPHGEPWEATWCPSRCPHRGAVGHQHMSSVRGSTRVNLVIDALYWRDRVPRVSRFKVAWWMLRATLALSLLYLIMPFGRAQAVLVRAEGWSKSRKALVGVAVYLLLMVLVPVLGIWIAMLVLRSMLILLAGLVAIVALILSGKVRLASDALAWCSDETFRETVIKECEQRVEGAGADATVLIGHSQGGSILTEMTRNQARPPKNQSLITLGSGQAILATLYEARSHPALTWMNAVAAVLGLILVVFGLLLAPVQVALRGLAELITMASTVVQHIWVWPLADASKVDRIYRTLSDRARLSANENFRQAFGTLTHPQHPPPMEVLLPFGLFSFMLLLVIPRVLIPTGRAIMERTRSSAEGLDLGASRDVVSRPLQVIGHPDRVVRIGQTGRLTLDHTSYLQNSVSVMPVIVQQIDEFARRRPTVPLKLSTDMCDADHEHRRQLSVLRPFQWFFGISLALQVFSLPLIGAGLIPYEGSSLLVSTLLAFVCFAVTLWLSRVYALHLLSRNSALGPVSQKAFLADSARARRDRKSWSRALVLLVFAIPQAGTLIPPLGNKWESWAAPAEAATLASLASTGTSAVFALTFSALLFIRGSQISKPMGVFAISLSAEVVLLMGSPFAFWIAAFHIVPLVWTCWPRRHRDKRGLGGMVGATSTMGGMAEKQHHASFEGGQPRNAVPEA